MKTLVPPSPIISDSGQRRFIDYRFRAPIIYYITCARTANFVAVFGKSLLLQDLIILFGSLQSIISFSVKTFNEKIQYISYFSCTRNVTELATKSYWTFTRVVPQTFYSKTQSSFAVHCPYLLRVFLKYPEQVAKFTSIISIIYRVLLLLLYPQPLINVCRSIQKDGVRYDNPRANEILEKLFRTIIKFYEN